ncbi:MAG: molybdopterin molybdotransferase MoeA [Thermoproteota archaeon]|nr:molybdopterin molybdotransferase MoeA [Thermoproteota archaeon]
MKKNSDLYFTVDIAFKILLENITVPKRVELVAVFESLGRILKDDVIAQENIPIHNSSHMDGYAIRSTDVTIASKKNPVLLKISHYESTLGNLPHYILKKGEAYRIQTGGYMPLKSDAVIPIENIKIINNDLVEIVKPIEKGSFVYSAGSDIKKGKKVLCKEQAIRVQHMGLLASLGISKISVFKKPLVSIIPTGNELTDDIEKNKGNKEKKVVNTNGHIISSLVSELGGISIDMGVTPDDVDILKRKMNHALKTTDLIITIGGTSAGKQDIVKSTIDSMASSRIIAHKIKLDRGRVTGLAAVNKKPILIMPGPIQGTLNAFFVFARPLISLFSGQTTINVFTISAIMVEDWTCRKKFYDFRKIVYVNLIKLKDKFYAKPIIGETQSISLIVNTNAYVIVPENVTNLFKGDIVQVNILPGYSYVNDIQFMG